MSQRKRRRVLDDEELPQRGRRWAQDTSPPKFEAAIIITTHAVVADDWGKLWVVNPELGTMKRVVDTTPKKRKRK